MTDRGKVIKGLEIHTNMYATCKDCPYWDGVGSTCHDLLNDALKVLKEQEAVSPISRSDPKGNARYLVCGKCDEIINVGDKYCRRCGREVKWE